MDGEKVEDHFLMRMASQITHRGPDGHGIWKNNRTGLVHCLLSIIDLEAGDQPVRNEEDQYGSFLTTRLTKRCWMVD